MRYRPLVVAAVLLLPTVSFAQVRAPRIGGRRPGQPVPLSPQPPEVARAQAYVRSRYSVESYPLMSRVSTPGVSSYTSVGTGTRLDWRLTPYMSWTFDLTGAYLAGPAIAETAELGVRFRSESWEQRLRPFADVRFGFEHAYESFAQNTPLGIGPASGLAGTNRYSRGFGGVLGAGVETSITNTFALTTAVSVMRTNMETYRMQGISVPTAGDNFRMTTYRLAVGIRYNPVHMVRSSNTP